jgi:hypothetical protein
MVPRERSLRQQCFRGPDDIAPALAAVAASVADGVISVDEAALVANVLQKFLDVLEILETAHTSVAGCHQWTTGASDPSGKYGSDTVPFL